MTAEQEQFIIDNFNRMSCESLRNLFNDTYGTSYKVTAFHYHTDRLGLKKHVEHQYTAREDEFLRANAQKMTRKELTDRFNQEFNTSVDYRAISVYCWKRGYIPKSDGKFKKGSVPWEKTKGGREEYLKTIKGGNSRSFKKGNIPPIVYDVGTERMRGDELFVKTDDGWKSKRRLVWESVYGEIPDGYMVISIDGDKLNTDINNIRLIDNDIMTVLISNKWNDKGADVVDTGIMYATLRNLLKEGEYEQAD